MEIKASIPPHIPFIEYIINNSRAAAGQTNIAYNGP